MNVTGPAGVPAFMNHLPVRIRFGEGVAGEVPGVVAGHAVRRAFVLIDDGLEERSAAVAGAIGALEESGVETVRFVKPAGEPTMDMVDAAADALREAEAGAILAIGGGSVIDTAKGARLCAQRGLAFVDVVADPSFPDPVVPLIALPTTAGTGSEVSGGAVVTDPVGDRKSGIAHPNLRAQHALVDPVLTFSVPPAVTAHTGVDALAQAIAGTIARVSTPIGDAIALESIRLISRSLVRAHRNGADAAARSEMACGSLMAGLTMNISDCTAEHSLAQAVGGVFHLPHGLTVGVLLAETLERERRHVPDRLERVADAMGVPDDDTGDGSRAVLGVRELLAQLDFPVLRSLGVDESHVDDLARAAIEDFFHTQSPRPWTVGEARAAFEAALALTGRELDPARAA